MSLSYCKHFCVTCCITVCHQCYIQVQYSTDYNYSDREMTKLTQQDFRQHESPQVPLQQPSLLQKQLQPGRQFKVLPV